MLTYSQLLRVIPYKRSKFKERVGHVTSSINKAEIVKRGESKGVKFYAAGRATTEKVYYKCEVEMYPQEIATEGDIEKYKNLDVNTRCWVHCNCPFFTFHCEYVLADAGSSELRLATDNPPHITNPGMKQYTCKHIHSVLPKALAALKKISVP